MELIERMKGRLSTACFGSADAKDAEELIERYEEARAALRLACEDAWPGQPQWPELYLQRAGEGHNTTTDKPQS